MSTRPSILFVAPDGDDANPGTRRSPFATLPRARDAVREGLRGRPDGDHCVYLRGGRYEMAEPLVLGPKDSPRSGRVTYAAWPGETPVLSRARTVEGWRRLDTAPDGSGAAERRPVWVASVPKGQRFYALFDDQGLLTRAHSERMTTDPDRQAVDPRRQLCFRPGDMADWPDLDQAELFITPQHSWTVNYLPLESVDEPSGIAVTALPGTYDLVTPSGNRDIALFYRVENRLAYLNGPGQWALDAAAGRLYLWPRGDAPRGILAPWGCELVRIQGDADTSAWARNIRLEGITFSHGDRMAWGPDRRSLQHDWEQEDSPNALLRLRDTERIEVCDCRFRDSGSGGLRMDRHAVENVVRRCEFAELGGTGIALVGYGPGSRDENHHHTVAHNHIHHIGRLWWQSSGIFISQSGHNRVCDNRIHHAPYNGLTVSGPRSHLFNRSAPIETEGSRSIRWEELGESLGEAAGEWWAQLGWKHSRFNRIEHNEIHHVMEWIGDGNGIYLSGTGEGNLVRRNYVHDIPGAGTAAGIRNDDEQFFTLVEENVIWKINAAGIITKNINMIENNIVVDCYGAPEKGFCYISLRHRGPSHGTGIRRNILLRPRNGHTPKRPFLENTRLLAQAAADDNLFWCDDRPQEAEAEIKDHRTRNKCLRTVAADPRFVDAAGGDFRLQPDSPAYRIGFRQIEHWGVRGAVGPDRTGEQDRDKATG